MLLHRTNNKFKVILMHCMVAHWQKESTNTDQVNTRFTLQTLLHPHLNPSACPARWSPETALLYREEGSRTVHSTVCSLQQKLLYTGCLWLNQPTAWRETIRGPESVSEPLLSLHIWDWFVMSEKHVVQDKDSMDHLTGHRVSFSPQNPVVWTQTHAQIHLPLSLSWSVSPSERSESWVERKEGWCELTH